VSYREDSNPLLYMGTKCRRAWQIHRQVLRQAQGSAKPITIRRY
jgi:hypothetical protein